MNGHSTADEEVIDPFAGIVDDPDPGAAGMRSMLLTSALRGYAPIRKVFVQRASKETGSRASALAALVTGRHQRALDAYLLLHALQPILPGSPLALRTWARVLSTRTNCTSNAASKAFGTLIDLKLVTRTGGSRNPVIQPLLEDGSGQPWAKPGLSEETGPGYFTLPHEYWTQGFADTLTLPGKAMLLILLSETQTPTKTAMALPVERAAQWYGVSERTAERGYGELRKAGVLLVKITKVADPRHPAGRREVYWRALATPFGTVDRSRLQQVARKATKASAPAPVEPEQLDSAATAPGAAPPPGAGQPPAA